MLQTGTFYTTVNNENSTETKRALANIFIYFSQNGVRKLTTKTDAAGKFSFDLALGDYQVTISQGANFSVHSLAGGATFSLTSESKIDDFENWVMTPIAVNEEDNPLVVRLSELAKIAKDSATEAQAIQDMIFATSGLYASITDGLNATDDGGVFMTPSAINNMFISVYRNENGRGVLLSSVYGNGYIDSIKSLAIDNKSLVLTGISGIYQLSNDDITANTLTFSGNPSGPVTIQLPDRTSARLFNINNSISGVNRDHIHVKQGNSEFPLLTGVNTFFSGGTSLTKNNLMQDKTLIITLGSEDIALTDNQTMVGSIVFTGGMARDCIVNIPRLSGNRMLTFYNATSKNGFNIILKSERNDYVLPKGVSQVYSNRTHLFPVIDSDTNKLSFKRWFAIGDSITEKNFRTTTNYHGYIKNRNEGLVVYNYGKSGSGYCSRLNVANEIVFDAQENDIMTIFFGTNDWANIGNYNKPLGQLTDLGDATLTGCMKIVIESLINKFPQCRFGLITPLPRIESYGIDGGKGVMGYSLEQVANRISELGEQYSIPVLNLYKKSGLAVWNEKCNAMYFTAPTNTEPDGLHPNDAGHYAISYKIEEFINNL